jgi:dipeptidyl aminopeptidase/acylaminoacyl peptidase
MTVDDLLAVKGVSDPHVSPDGKQVVYVLTEIDREANKSNSDLWLVPVAGGEPRRLTTAPGSDTHPRWNPDGKTIAFLSTRGGSAQIWLLPVEGGEARALTKLPVDVSGPIWSPRGDRLACVASVYPGMTPEKSAELDKTHADSKSQAKTFDSLMIRHWTEWETGKKSHLFVVDAATGDAKDLTPNWNANIPPAPFGGSSDYSWSADGASIAFVSEPLENPAWSTNTDIWLVSTSGGEARNISGSNKGADAQPAFSPDGRMLAWLSQERAGFEADQWVLSYLPVGELNAKPVAISKAMDRSIGSFRWQPDRPEIVAVVDDGGYTSVWSLPTLVRRAPILVSGKASHSAAEPVAGGALVLARSTTASPTELYRIDSAGGAPQPLTRHNEALVAQLDLSPAESFTFSGADGDQVQGWLVKPPGFDPAKKYPVVFLIHGGPQGAWHDEWHNRWNYGLFAAPGYCVVAVNPRGSTGFGQRFTDQISRDWFGRVVVDLYLGLKHALEKNPFLDSDRMAAAGASFGGYMINWIAGHPDSAPGLSDKFRCLVSHAGIFDLTSMNIATEELWFAEWEFGGSPWDTPEVHLTQSPSTYVKNFKIPSLVLHGALDFRVPDTQGIAMFTALQRRGVPSRFVYFPDEGHWISKPGNRAVWWKEVLGWLDQYLKN